MKRNSLLLKSSQNKEELYVVASSYGNMVHGPGLSSYLIKTPGAIPKAGHGLWKKADV